jgi:hypothetical protein
MSTGEIDDTKPQLVLYWTMDCPAQRLWIQIAPDLTYEAHEGGSLGYTKVYQGETTHVSPQEWEEVEKYWISENYGDKYGYYRRTDGLVTNHPDNGWKQACANGLGRDGEYLDHMQRSQYVLESHDVATVYTDELGNLYQTPDNGKTIFVRKATRDVLYVEELENNPNAVWPDHPQACMMQPRSKSYQLSSYEELAAMDCSAAIIERCRDGEWESPLRPELQQYYVYPHS